MGRLKESIPDYIWDLPEEETNKFWLEKDIEAIVSNDKSNNEDLREFLNAVTPITGPDYFIYIKDEATDTYTNIKYNRKEYINALCCLSEEEYTVFYHIASFKGWIDNDSATAVRCIYVDIDDIDITADEADLNSVTSFLKDVLKLTEEQFPDYAVLSGHGLHACWLIEEITADKEEIRAKYTDSMITRLGGDFSGSPISHQFRCPCSYNLKDEVIKGKLFKLTECKNTDIHRLDWCLLSPEEVKKYRDNHYKRIHEKGLETRKKNKQLEKNFIEMLGNKSLEEYLSEDNISANNRKIAEKLLEIKRRKSTAEKFRKYISEKTDERISAMFSDDDLESYVYCDKALPFEHLHPYGGYKPENRTMNIILDLHNFFIRNKGCLVSRNIFFTILASLFKYKGESDRAAIKWCKKYVDSSYYDEMVETVLNVYKSDKIYRFSNERIAKLLCFTPDDIAQSYCCFSEERKVEAKRNRNKRYYEKRRKEDGKISPEEKQQMCLEYLRNHPGIKEKDGMNALNVSRTTFYELKKMITEDK